MKHLKRGLFFTFEGGEGSGKTTLQERLSKHLNTLGYVTLSTRAPGGTALGSSIRELLLHKKELLLSKQAELFLFLADRAQQVEEILLPALEKGHIILSDRFNDSTFAYQGVARGGDIAFIEKLCDYTVGGLLPDLTFYLDIDPKIGLQRAKEAIIRSGKAAYDRLEKEHVQFHEKVREGYLMLTKQYPHRVILIDASHSVESVFNEVLEKIQEKLQEVVC